jgi:hypothetical protein
MDKITFPDMFSNYDFNSLTLSTPISLPGGAFFTKISSSSNDVYIQTPLCSSKQGFVKSGRKIHIDLVYDKNNEHFCQFVENLENTLTKLIYEKRDEWFQEEVEFDDIENAFTNTLKSYKSGSLFLLRTMLDSPRMLTASTNLTIYDQQENLINMEDITPDTNMIPIIQLHGLKFTAKNFQIYLQIKQAMVVKNNLFNTCLIKNKVETKEISENNKPIKMSLSKSEPQDALENEDDLEQNEEKEVIEEETTPVIEANHETSENDIINDDVTPEHNEEILLSITDTSNDVNEDNKEETINVDTKTLDNEDVFIEDAKNMETIQKIENIKEPIINLEEYDVVVDNEDNLETITLKKPNDIYLDMYKEFRIKAREARKNALLSYLEAKKIKNIHMLDIDDSSDNEYEKQLDTTTPNNLEKLQ